MNDYKQEKIEDATLGEMYVIARESISIGFKRVQIDPKDLCDLISEVIDYRNSEDKK